MIKNLLWKFNYQLNSANKFQYLFQSDNKFRNARGASATTPKEATTQQTSDKPWELPLPTHSLTHTLIATDRLVFNNQFTYVHGGFFLDYQDVPPQGGCAQSRYLGYRHAASYQTGGRDERRLPVEHPVADATSTTSFNSRSLTATYQTMRHSWEAKTDGTYFLTNKLGGDHCLKFGVGWRKNPIMTFSHYSGGARAQQQCVGNNVNNCGNGDIVPVGSATGFVPRSGGPLPRPAAQQRLVDLQRLHPGLLQPRPVAPQRRPALRLAAVEVPGRLRAGRTSSCRPAAGAVRGRDRDRRRSPARSSSRSATGRRACR